MKKFINRNRELDFLNNEYKREGSSFVIIYGRRRVGKTSLIKKFVEDKKAIYFLATEEIEGENINSFKNAVASYLDDDILLDLRLDKWENVFDLILKRAEPQQKTIIVIDEFQYLGIINPSFPSIFQKIWDEKLKDKNIMVILCGSLIGMMEKQTLNYSSPLYGRRTGQIKLKQIQFKYYNEFYDDNLNLVEYYSVTGGVPKYIEIFKKEKDIFEAIKNNVLNKDSFLYEEPVFLLEKEVQDVGTYFSIIKSIALGNHKIGNIATNLGVPQTKLTKYLSILIDLDILIREVPITEGNPEKSKKGLYFINDNFIEFWFKFIYPYRSFIELDNIDFVLEKIKKTFYMNHVSFVYEDICRQSIWDMIITGEIPFLLNKVGRWWNSKQEIDIVGINTDTNDILFGECKYLNTPVDTDVFYRLMEKSKNVEWKNDNRNEYFVLFSKSGYTERMIELAKTMPNLLLK
ncbi:MAG: ATP-binding protein [Clostridiales bacterium]|nr:ATP-binding protein [Clostridiales bacterium]